MTDPAIANLIPPTPRPVTRRASMRSWAEWPVQLWWKAALIVAIVMIYVTAIQVRAHLRERDLLQNGEAVKVTIERLNNRKVGTGSYQPRRDVEHFVTLKGTMRGDQAFTYEGMLAMGPGHLELGGELLLRVDPNNPARWIEVREQRSLWEEFMAVFLLMPVIVILLAVAQWKRMGVLNVWKHGKVREGVVVDSKHSSIAPRSRVCRYTMANGDDRRVFPMIYPTRRGVPQPGDVLQLIVNPEQPGRAVVADLYVRQVDV